MMAPRAPPRAPPGRARPAGGKIICSKADPAARSSTRPAPFMHTSRCSA